MARIRTIWGPLETKRKQSHIGWRFSGAREDGTIAQWWLRFYFDTRTFKTRVFRRDVEAPAPGMFPEIERSEVKIGPVTPMLRARLKPEHIAEATRLALDYQRRRGR